MNPSDSNDDASWSNEENAMEPSSTQEAYEGFNMEYSSINSVLLCEYRFLDMTNIQVLTPNQTHEQSVLAASGSSDRLPLGESQQQNSYDKYTNLNQQPPPPPQPQLQPQPQEQEQDDFKPEIKRALELVQEDNLSGSTTIEAIRENKTIHSVRSAPSLVAVFSDGSRMKAEKIVIFGVSGGGGADSECKAILQEPTKSQASILQEEAQTRTAANGRLYASQPTALVAAPIKHRSSAARSRKSPEQLEILERSFAEREFPNTDERRRISEATGLEDEKVRLWFQHRRNRDKRKRAKGIAQPQPSAPTNRTKRGQRNDATSDDMYTK